MSKQHASIIEISSSISKIYIEIDDRVLPLLKWINKHEDMLKNVIEEKLTVWYLDGEGENRHQEIKPYIMKKFAEVEERTQELLAPLEKMLSSVQENMEEKHISINTSIDKLKNKVEYIDA